jgi:ubiquinone/menaquinone biosynthesis C-methylase UbiE
MAGLEFDEEVSQRIEAAYAGRDIARRRELVREALGVGPGERVLDVGCGPGFYVAELLEAVGSDGAVVGVDSSEAMLALAAMRCAGHENADFRAADATALPVDDGSFDAALSVQVLEYVADVPAALGELRRALRPGGRLVLWDVDWATLSLRSDDGARMQRVLAAWDEHLTHVSLPQTLSAQLRDAGFADVRMNAYAFATTELDPETYGGFLVPFLEGFVVDRDAVPAAEARAWADEQRALAERGEFYFCVTQVRFAADAA